MTKKQKCQKVVDKILSSKEFMDMYVKELTDRILYGDFFVCNDMKSPFIGEASVGEQLKKLTK